MRVKVTEDHIRLGRPGLPCYCPVALAIIEAVGFEARVHGDYVHFPDIDDLCVDLPRRARKFISDFDDRAQVRPFSFQIEMP